LGVAVCFFALSPDRHHSGKWRRHRAYRIHNNPRLLHLGYAPRDNCRRTDVRVFASPLGATSSFHITYVITSLNPPSLRLSVGILAKVIAMSRRFQSFIVVLLLILSFTFISPRTSAANPPSIWKSSPIPVKVVLVGFDQNQIDIQYLTSGYGANTESVSGVSLPNSITNEDSSSGNDTGVVFRPQYSFTFASGSFKQNLLNYLTSIEQHETGVNPWFVKFAQDKQNPDYFDQNPVAVNYTVYDANSVENWLWNHGQDFGGYPANGWTLILTYLPDLPSITWPDLRDFEKTNAATLPKSTPHYYGISSTDADLGYVSRYRDFMDAWGGHHRMWFVDLSAGPVFNSQWEDLPLQVQLGDNNIDTSTSFGKTWLTETVGDYVAQATYNFIAPGFVYYPQYSPKYQIDVFVFDDRNSTERASIPIQKTVNKDMIQAAFTDLVPYSSVTVNLNFPDVPSDLHNLIQSSYKYTDSWIEGATPERYGVVDLRPVYDYMLKNFATYEKNPRISAGLVTIPAFAFAFSGETYFTYTYKWFIGKTDWETGALLGIAMPEAAFISLNQWSFTRGDQITPPQPGKGEGMTQTIIHELGHEFGLSHPHNFGNIGDFITSPMGYFTDDYKFQLFDKDALWRAHVDELYLQTELLLSKASAGTDATQAQSKLAEVDADYSQMNYSDAIQPVLAAYQLAAQAAGVPQSQFPLVLQMGSAPSTSPPFVFLAVGIVVGVAIALVAVVALRRRR
jgi:hypothetical protein